MGVPRRRNQKLSGAQSSPSLLSAPSHGPTRPRTAMAMSMQSMAEPFDGVRDRLL
ncbi:MAG: hypothetical protein IRY90_22120 [Actinomadura rubrobrunea]|nr:hypothetical protein [Actinomadura rubrobrunea]